MLGIALPCARANGRFPRAQFLVGGFGEASRSLLVRATFGLALSDDAGGSFHFVCEEAFGYPDGYDPAVALNHVASVLVGLPDGLAIMRDRCNTRRVADLANFSVVDLATDRTGLVVLAAVASSDVTPVARLARSEDGGQSFRLSRDARAGLQWDTVEVAPSDPQRIYASATEPPSGTARFIRSADGGATWNTTSARFDTVRSLFVSAVDPARADVVYVRARLASSSGDDAGASDATILMRSTDAGESFTEIARTRGPMYGFALSDDGRTVWIGGPDSRDGLQRSRDGGAFERVSDTPVECLRYHAGSLYACHTFRRGGVFVSRAVEPAIVPAPLAQFSDIGSPFQCPAGTLVADICTLRWQTVRRQISDTPASDGGADASRWLRATGGGGCACTAARRSRHPRAASPGVIAALVALLIIASRAVRPRV